MSEWTQSAYECYKVGQDCTRCPTNLAIGHATRDYGPNAEYGCQMPKTLKKLGTPGLSVYGSYHIGKSQAEQVERFGINDTDALNALKTYETGMFSSADQFIDYYSNDIAEARC